MFAEPAESRREPAAGCGRSTRLDHAGAVGAGRGGEVARTGHLARRLRRGVIVASIGLLALFAVALPASAHGGDETQEGYLLVQQALGHLAHDTGHKGIALAMEKVDDALAAKDQDGVAVVDVEQAKRALDAGRVGQARALLQGSIKEALSKQGPATGEQTGTTVVVPALPGRQGLTGRDWGFLAASLIFLAAGTGLAFRFRPRDTVGELRRSLGVSHTAVDGGAGQPEANREP